MVIIKSARKMKNNTFAMEAAPSAIPPNPNMAATIAIMKKITDQRNITQSFRCIPRETYRPSLFAVQVHSPDRSFEIFVPGFMKLFKASNCRVLST